jgi:hypothetical protein
MLCSCCHGQHFVIRAGQMLPCPECGGIGEIHCCDGLTAQPDFDAPACSAQASDTESTPYRPLAR